MSPLRIQAWDGDHVYGIFDVSQWFTTKIISQPQGGAPPVISRFINPINYRYNPLINPSEIVLINQLNAFRNWGTTLHESPLLTMIHHHHPYAPCCWKIYQHWPANLSPSCVKVTSTMEHMGHVSHWNCHFGNIWDLRTKQPYRQVPGLFYEICRG